MFRREERAARIARPSQSSLSLRSTDRFRLFARHGFQGIVNADASGRACSYDRVRPELAIVWDGHAPHSHPDSSDVRHPQHATELLIQRSHSRGQGTKLYATPSGHAIAYGAGRTAVIRSIGGPDAPSAATSEPLLFTHAQPVTVVRPLSEYYAASGDAAGNVKVWDTASGNYSLKLEAKPIARINDIAVDGEGQRIIVVGEGKSAFGASFSLSTGSSIGEISGHSKVVNAVALRPGRPFKAA